MRKHRLINVKSLAHSHAASEAKESVFQAMLGWALRNDPNDEILGIGIYLAVGFCISVPYSTSLYRKSPSFLYMELNLVSEE